MLNHNSAQLRDETPHATNSITNKPISEALKRRAQSLINDRIIDASERTWIRYALEIMIPHLRKWSAALMQVSRSSMTRALSETMKKFQLNKKSNGSRR